MIINNKKSNNIFPMPAISIENEVLERVTTYKYLGIEFNDQLKLDKQWESVQNKTKTIPYLVKRLKYLGFKKDILLSVYDSYALSHFRYSAPLLAHCTPKVSDEIQSFQRRIMRIINISNEEAKSKYNIDSIDRVIETHCVKILQRILADPQHPITSKIPRVENRRFKYSIPNHKTKQYSQSFVPLILRVIRDGDANLYTTSKANKPSSNRAPPSPLPTATTKMKKPCPICGKQFIRVQQHITMTHKNKTVMQPSNQPT
jgi:hypothetical protein